MPKLLYKQHILMAFANKTLSLVIFWLIYLFCAKIFRNFAAILDRNVSNYTKYYLLACVLHRCIRTTVRSAQWCFVRVPLSL